LLSEAIQVQGAIALDPVSRNGVTIDPKAFPRVKRKYERALDKEIETLHQDYPDLFKVRNDGQFQFTKKTGVPSKSEKALDGYLLEAVREIEEEAGETLEVSRRKDDKLAKSTELWKPLADRHRFIERWLKYEGWIRLLRRYTGRHLKSEPDFTRPSRRFPSLVGVIPGKRRRGGRPHVMAVIDTSASISPDLLELINGELSRIAADHEVTVVECDAEIQRVDPFRRMRSVRGRGGTDLRPPFEPGFLRRHGPDLIIYFTDGCGPAPEHPPRVPVIWCLTEDGEAPAEWGRILRMDSKITI
jgi:predicted metal-dependent peptidase